MGKKEELHRFESETGVTRVRQTRSGDIVIDSYFGDVKDKNNHDRLSLNVTQGTLSGHDYGQTNKFDTGKDKGKTK